MSKPLLSCAGLALVTGGLVLFTPAPVWAAQQEAPASSRVASKKKKAPKGKKASSRARAPKAAARTLTPVHEKAPVPKAPPLPVDAPVVALSPASGGSGEEVPSVQTQAPEPTRSASSRPPILMEVRALVGVPDLGGVSVTALPWSYLTAEVGGAPALKTFYLRAGAFWPLLDERLEKGETHAWVIRTGGQLGLRHFGEFGLGFNAVAELAGTYWFPKNLGANFQLTAGAVHVGPEWQFGDFQRVATPWFPDVRLSGGVTFLL